MHAVTRRGLLAGSLAGLAVGQPVRAQGVPFVCGIMDVAPWVTRDPLMPGIGVDIIAHLMAATDIPIETKPAPHPRLVMELRGGQIDLTAFVPQAELEEAGLFLGTLGRLEIGLITRAGLSLLKIEEMSGRSIGVVRGSGMGPLIDMLPPGAERVAVRDVAQALDMIAAGRIDSFMGSRLAADWHMHQNNMNAGLFGPFFVMGEAPINLYLSRARAYPAEIVERLAAGAGIVRAGFEALCDIYRRKV